MRKWHRGGCGLAAIAVGVIIILAIVLPSQFWWFMLAMGLICAGVWLNRRNR